ncbi:MAG: hypothetical protein Q9225_003487 [Loekoesia sp. 1 TL-2023]
MSWLCGIPQRPKFPLYPYIYPDTKLKSKAAIDADGWAWWRNSVIDPWRKAAFHSVLRPALIAEAAQQGAYTFPRPSGPSGPHDITSYHPKQDWGLDRAHRPPKTFQFARTKEMEPNYPVEMWVWRGIIILDFRGQPLLNYGALPATISSKENGCFLEGMYREDPRLKWTDFVARMPMAPHPPLVYKPVVEYQTFAMRRTRFRIQAGCIAWTMRDGSDDLRELITQKLPVECIEANSTQGFRDFTPYEIKEIELATKGKHPELAGTKRALSENKRKQVKETFLRRMERAKRKEEEQNETQAKRTREEPEYDEMPDMDWKKTIEEFLNYPGSEYTSVEDWTDIKSTFTEQNPHKSILEPKFSSQTLDDGGEASDIPAIQEQNFDELDRVLAKHFIPDAAQPFGLPSANQASPTHGGDVISHSASFHSTSSPFQPFAASRPPPSEQFHLREDPTLPAWQDSHNYPFYSPDLTDDTFDSELLPFLQQP